MKHLTCAVAGIVMLAAYAAQADLPAGTTIDDFLPEIGSGTIDTGNAVFTYDRINEFEQEGSKYKLKGEFISNIPNGTLTLEEIEFDPDPMVTSSILLHNITGSYQTYSFYVSQPSYLATSSSQIRGSVVVSLLDDAADGAEIKTSGTDPIYTAIIDGAEVATLLDAPYSLTALAGGESYVSADPAEFGWDPYGAGVNTDIGIQLKISLSPGDTATVLSRFEVIDVIPEPNTIFLMGFGIFGLIGLKRKLSM